MKRHLIGIFLCLFGLWPAVHAALVVRYDIDPWKLFGWSMYAVPGSMKTVRIEQFSRDGPGRLLDYRKYEPELEKLVERFRESRRTLGLLAPADDLAEAILEFYPDWEGVAITVITLRLSRLTATTVADATKDVYWRDGRDSVAAQTPNEP